MNNPPHPGEFIREVYLQASDMSLQTVAAGLRLSPAEFDRLLNGKICVTPDLAERLSQTLGRSPESWLAMQANYDRATVHHHE